MKAIRLERFKGYEDSGWIDLDKPITLILGNNSSGKSALLSAILMLKQSSEAIDLEKPFVFNSEKGIDIGSFEDAVYKHIVDIKKPMIFSFQIVVDKTYQEISLNAGDSVILSIKVTYNKKRRFITVIGFNLSKLSDKKVIINMYKKSNSFNAKAHYSTDLKLNLSNLKLKWFYFIPLILFDLDENSTIGQEVNDLNKAIAVDLAHFFDEIIHIGPLRKEPERTYHFTGETPSNVGRDGRDTHQILLLDKYSATTQNIINKVDSNLKKLGYSLSWDILKGGLAHLMLTELDSKTSYNLKDVGFGISQLLPVLVQGYAAHKSQYVLLEQPEIHLHPSAQANVGDFFISLSKQKKNFIIETHSEHLLLRIRRRIADQTISNKDVNILFVERVNGKSIISNIEFDEYGQMIKIPDGFKTFFSDDFEEVVKISDEISKRKKNEALT